MLKFKKSEEKIANAFRIIEFLQKSISFIKSQKLSDKGFINFLCSLIQYQPKDRPKFEEIYRNEWLNKDKDKINIVFNSFENDEEKLIMELQKLDFLIKKENELNNDILYKDRKPDIIKKNISRFRFKKKNSNI